MNQILIKTIELENKLTLDFYDESIKMIGDRWIVTLVARIKIAVDKVLTPENRLSLPDEDEIKKMLGKEVVFEQKSNRIFVDKDDKINVLQELSDTFIENTLPYLSHADFPQRFLAKKIKEQKDKQLHHR